jgi:hypothetical protein
MKSWLLQYCSSICTEHIAMEMQECILFFIVIELKTFNNAYTVLPSLNSRITFHMKRAILWKIYAISNNKTQLDRQVKCLIFLFDFNKVRIFVTELHTSPQYQNSRKSVKWESS